VLRGNLIPVSRKLGAGARPTQTKNFTCRINVPIAQGPTSKPTCPIMRLEDFGHSWEQLVALRFRELRSVNRLEGSAPVFSRGVAHFVESKQVKVETVFAFRDNRFKPVERK
jgi:hypothetical protein